MRKANLATTALLLLGGAVATSGSGCKSKEASEAASLSPAAAAARGLALYDAEPADMKGAKTYCESACSRGDQTGCMCVGLVAVWGGDKDYATGLQKLDAACTAGVLRGCAALGKLYLNGWGTSKDAAKARALFQKACDGGDARGCEMLGVLLTASDAPPEWHDARAGLTYLQKECEGGQRDACTSAASLQAATQPQSSSGPNLDALRKKVSAKYWGFEKDDNCTAGGKPPYRKDYTGGTYEENETVALADGCDHLFGSHMTHSPNDNTFCCPK